MGALRKFEAAEGTMPTLSPSEPPPSGVRLRSTIVEEGPVSTSPVSIVPISIAPASAANANADHEDEVPLEEAIPLSHNTILAILFGATAVLSAIVLSVMPS